MLDSTTHPVAVSPDSSANSLSALELEKMRQQFDEAPYPNIPLEERANENDLNLLYFHNLATPFYLRNQQLISTEGRVILDAGCGTGYKSMTLAIANPGAKIVGVDLSPASVELAQQRLAYHGIDNAEFFAISIEDLPSLGLKFDYINADEVLYLLPNPTAGLQAMQAVLKPGGIIRTNLHSALQRVFVFRFQEVFKMMGLMDGAIGDLEVDLAREVVHAIKDKVFLKAHAWGKDYDETPELLRPNCLLQGDKGFTVPDMFAMLQAANLEFISMVRWQQWELMSLFKDPNDLPPFLAMSLPEASIEERLHLFELFQPIHRLLDFWCGHVGDSQDFTPVAEWPDEAWQTVTVHLHPQLQPDLVKQSLVDSVTYHSSFEITRFLAVPATTPIVLESSMAASLIPLWEGPQPFNALVDRWLKVHPYNLVTLEPTPRATAAQQIQKLLTKLEIYTYVLLERE